MYIIDIKCPIYKFLYYVNNLSNKNLKIDSNDLLLKIIESVFEKFERHEFVNKVDDQPNDMDIIAKKYDIENLSNIPLFLDPLEGT